MKHIVKQWTQLSNGYWLKMMFTTRFNSYGYVVYTDMVVGKTRRHVNDSFSKSEISPKNLMGKSTNHNSNGIEALVVALKMLLDFEKTLPKNYEIRVYGADNQRVRVYRRLLRYGYSKVLCSGQNKNTRPFYVKIIKEA